MSWGECPALEHDWEHVLSWRNLLSGLACLWSSGRVLGPLRQACSFCSEGLCLTRHTSFMLFIEWDVLVCTSVSMQQTCGSQETTSFFPSILWTGKIDLKLPGLAAGTVTCWSISRTYLQSVTLVLLCPLRQGPVHALHVQSTEPHHQPDSPVSLGPPPWFNKPVLGSFPNHLPTPHLQIPLCWF